MTSVEVKDVARLQAQLDFIASYLMKALELTRRRKKNMPVVFAWDWEMLYEVIYGEKASSSFSNLLMHGLECLQASERPGTDWRILIPEGTRRELLHHLKKLVMALRKSAHVIEASSATRRDRSQNYSLTRFADKPDWHGVLNALDTAPRSLDDIDRILSVLDRFASPSPLAAAEIPVDNFQYYLQRMGRARRGHDRHNEADAYNLAVVDELCHRAANTHDSPNIALVTATRAVRQSEEYHTADPVLFFLEAELRKRFPKVNVRYRRLCGMLSRVLSQLARLRDDDYAARKTKELTRKEIADILDQILSLSTTIRFLPKSAHCF